MKEAEEEKAVKGEEEDHLAATNPKTNLARCFRCERNFNTIDMVMICNGLRFVEGVKYLKTILNNGS